MDVPSTSSGVRSAVFHFSSKVGFFFAPTVVVVLATSTTCTLSDSLDESTRVRFDGRALVDIENRTRAWGLGMVVDVQESR